MNNKTKSITAVVTVDDHLHEVTKYKDKIVFLDNALDARDKLVDSQRRKIVDLREQKYSLQSQVDQLHMDLELEKDEFLKISLEKKASELKLMEKQNELESTEVVLEKLRSVENEVNKPQKQDLLKKIEASSKLAKELQSKLEASEFREKKANEKMQSLTIVMQEINGNLENELNLKSEENLQIKMKLEIYETENRKFRDEIDAKDAKLSEFENRFSSREAIQDVMKSTQTSLSDELKKVSLEEMQKNKRICILEKLNLLGETRNEEISKLKESIENLKVKRMKPKCAFGWLCKKITCKFDHTFLYSKVNSTVKAPVAEREREFLCDLCGKAFKDRAMFMHHSECCIVIVEKADSDIKVPNECRKCFKVFASKFKLKKHMQTEHINFECHQCSKYFASQSELQDHKCYIHENQDGSKTKENEKEIEKEVPPIRSEVNENPTDVKRNSKYSSKPKKTKNEDYFRDNLIIVSAEQHKDLEFENDTDENETDEEFTSDDSSDTIESEVENSEAESGEICSDE